mgnify:CR=1 FL=1
MKDYDKVLRKANPYDRDRVEEAIENIVSGKLTGPKMKGSVLHKVRVGDFRIIYRVRENNRIEVVEVRRRNEQTYRDF